MGAYESKLLKEFEVEKVLGSGAFGMVIQTKNKFDLTSYAIKLVGLSDSEQQSKAINELRVFSKIASHQNVVSYKASWMDSVQKSAFQKIIKDLSVSQETLKRVNLSLQVSTLNILCIQMELCGPNLRTWMRARINEGKDINERKFLRIFTQITKGLQHIHKHNIIHRDLKPENIFVREDVVQIGDLGLAKYVYNISDLQTHTANGTICYMPQEQMSGKYGNAVDIYPLGMIMTELFAAVKHDELFRLSLALRAGILPPTISKKWPEVGTLIKRMLHHDPTARIKISEILDECKKLKKYFMRDRHDGITCDGCQIDPIRGQRFHCLDCENFDFCENCKETAHHDTSHKFEQMTEEQTRLWIVKALMGEIKKSLGQPSSNEDSSSSSKVGINCWRCGEKDLTGTVHKCTRCKNSYYCIDCYKASAKHRLIHTFETMDAADESSQTQNGAGLTEQLRNELVLEILRRIVQKRE